jgi:hypothetical protein
MGQQGKKHTHKQFSMRHTKLKALSFGSLKSSSFNDRTCESIDTGEGSGGGGFLIGRCFGRRCYHYVV